VQLVSLVPMGPRRRDDLDDVDGGVWRQRTPIDAPLRRSVSPAGSVFSLAGAGQFGALELPPAHRLREANPRVVTFSSAWDESTHSAISAKARIAAGSRASGPANRGILPRTSSLLTFSKNKVKVIKGLPPPQPPPLVDEPRPVSVFAVTGTLIRSISIGLTGNC
jgi:predicted small lipoprotein YifL